MVIHAVTAIKWLIKKYFHFGILLFWIIGIRLIVIGNNLALVSKTAKKIFNKLPPAINISAIINCPGNANAKNVEEKLCNNENPELLRNAPNVNMLKPKPITGTPKEYLIPCLVGIVR